MKGAALAEILAARDARSARQASLAARWGRPIASLTLVSPGAVKDSGGRRLLLQSALAALVSSLEARGVAVLERRSAYGIAGPEALLVADCSPEALKDAALAVEEGQPWGRLVDADVLAPVLEKGQVRGVSAVRRESRGRLPRSCLVCDRPAAECIGERRHSASELALAAQELLDRFAASDHVSPGGARAAPSLGRKPPSGGAAIDPQGGSTMKRSARILAALLVVAVAVCGAFAQKAPSNYPTRPMEFIAPAGAGGGWDTTIRMVANALQQEKIVPVAMPVTNRTGGGGGVNLAYLQTKKGADDIISVYSPPIIFIKLNGTSQYGYKDTTPIARLIADYGAFYVGKSSKYKNLIDVLEALKKDPKSVKVGGTSAAGSMDHIVFLYVAKAYGVKNLKQIQYIAFQDNTGPTQLMGGFIDVFSADIGSLRGLVESGDLKILGITAPERIGTGLVATYPTCKEQGVDAVFENWRGLFGPPGMPEYALAYWREALAKLAVSPTWKKIMEQNAWTPAYLDTPGFNGFLNRADLESREIFEELGILVK